MRWGATSPNRVIARAERDYRAVRCLDTASASALSKEAGGPSSTATVPPWPRRTAFDQLIADDGEVARGLRSFFSRRRFGAQSAMSLPVPALGSDPALILHFLPLRQAAPDIFSRAQMLLVVTRVVGHANALPQVIAGLFDLTPAEMTLATALTTGTTLPDFARQRGISHETVRTQLKSLMLKTGTHHQVELVRLLIGAAAFPAR